MDKSDGGKTSKSAGKSQACQHSDKALSGTRDRPVCYDQNFLTGGCKDKYPKDHISVHCVQQAGKVLLMSCLDVLPEGQKMLNIFFHTDVTLTDGSTLLGGEWQVIGQVYFGILTCQKLELHFEICHGSSKFIKDSFLEFRLYKTSHFPVNCTLHTTLDFEEQVI